MLSREDVEHNCEGIRAQLERFLDFSGSNGVIMVNNADWLCDVRLLDFMRDIGKYFSVNALLNRDSVRARLEDRDSGISFTEFSYILLQAYDYLHLNKEYNCRLQVGGADQWGNIVSGMDITRRLNNVATFGLTFPLVTKSDGAKFGKSEQGNIWLDSTRTSPYQFYQFWINQADDDVSRFLRFFTFLPKKDIEELDQQIKEAPQERLAQRRLAEEVTRLVHGETALSNAAAATKAMFGGDWTGLDAQTLLDVFSEVPHTEQPMAALQETALLTDLLVQGEVFASKGEARRLIRNGGLYVNNERIEKEDMPGNAIPLLAGNILVARKGKKSYHLIKFV